MDLMEELSVQQALENPTSVQTESPQIVFAKTVSLWGPREYMVLGKIWVGELSNVGGLFYRNGWVKEKSNRSQELEFCA